MLTLLREVEEYGPKILNVAVPHVVPPDLCNNNEQRQVAWLLYDGIITQIHRLQAGRQKGPDSFTGVALTSVNPHSVLHVQYLDEPVADPDPRDLAHAGLALPPPFGPTTEVP